jgi:hypothetical protein
MVFGPERSVPANHFSELLFTHLFSATGIAGPRFGLQVQASFYARGLPSGLPSNTRLGRSWRPWIEHRGSHSGVRRARDL